MARDGVWNAGSRVDSDFTNWNLTIKKGSFEIRSIKDDWFDEHSTTMYQDRFIRSHAFSDEEVFPEREPGFGCCIRREGRARICSGPWPCWGTEEDLEAFPWVSSFSGEDHESPWWARYYFDWKHYHKLFPLLMLGRKIVTKGIIVSSKQRCLPKIERNLGLLELPTLSNPSVFV